MDRSTDMKTLIACVAALTIFGFLHPVLGQEIQGGIVYSNGKEVIYYDLSTKKATDLLADQKKNTPKIVSAISENGQWLTWIERGKLWVRKLPFGKPYLAPSRSNTRWIPDDDPMSKRTSRLARIWEDIPDTIPGIPRNFCLSADGQMLSYEIRTSITIYDPRAYTRRGFANYLVIQPVSGNAIGLGGPVVLGSPDSKAYGAFINGRQIQAKTACLPSWSKKGSSLAFINKKGLIWESTEVRYDCHIDPSIEKKGSNFYQPQETKASLFKGCQGLAWKPDKTVTHLTNGTLYSETGEVVAKGIQGEKVCWISNETFVFRGRDSKLYLWNQGHGKKILDFVPESFSYTRRSPFDKEEEVVAKEINSSQEKEIFKTQEISSFEFPIVMGNINVKMGIRDPKTMRIWIGALKDQGQLDFVSVPVASVKDIKDPAAYEYKRLLMQMLSYEKVGDLPYLGRNPSGHKNDPKLLCPTAPCISLKINQVILLRMVNRYAAIKFLSVGKLIKSRTGLLAPMPTIEWRYWPASTASENIVTAIPEK